MLHVKNKKGGVKMNEKSTLTMLQLETAELKEFSGYWSWKEIYEIIKKYEKSNKWKILKIEKEN